MLGKRSLPGYGLLWPAVGLTIMTGGLPLLFFWAIVGRVPSLSTAEARRELASANTLSVLVDIREPSEQIDAALPGAVVWPYSTIAALNSPADIPGALKGKTLLLLCSSGINSARAAEVLNRLEPGKAYSIQGGVQSWWADEPETGPDSTGLNFKALPKAEQGALVAAVYLIKPIYMILTLAAIAWLWGQTASGLVALRWSMIFFMIGETFCAVNIVGFYEESSLLEYLHSFGMVVCLACLVYAALIALDEGLLHFTNPQVKCAFMGLCNGCAKYGKGPCLLERLFKWGLPLGLIIAAMPLNANPAAIAYNTQVFGIPSYLTHPVIIQFYEIRFDPVMAVILMTGAWLTLIWAGRRDQRLQVSRLLLAAGLGHLGFAFLRLMLFAFYRDDLVWFVFWEEATELILVAGLLLVLYLFRADLRLRVITTLEQLYQ